MKISVIVPVYNSKKYISRCIDSILKQTYTDFELILINDGSSDNSLCILNEYKKKDKRIKVINQKNMGVANTRNKGVELSSGEYITFIDNDDYLEVDYLEKFMLESDDFDIIVGGYKRVNDDKVLYEKKISKTNWSKYENVAPWAKLIKRQFLIDNNIKFFSHSIGEDIIFSMDLYTLTDKIKVLDYCGYNWYFNNDSVSNTTQKVFDKNILLLFDKMMEHDRTDETKYFISRYFIWYLLFSGRCVNGVVFMSEYNKVKKWLLDNNYYGFLNLVNIVKNESSFSNKIIIFVFNWIEKLKLMRFFSKVYCRGDK